MIQFNVLFFLLKHFFTALIEFTHTTVSSGIPEYIASNKRITMVLCVRKIIAFRVVILSDKIFIRWCRGAMDRFASFLIYDIDFGWNYLNTWFDNVQTAHGIQLHFHWIIEWLLLFCAPFIFEHIITAPMIMIDLSSRWFVQLCVSLLRSQPVSTLLQPSKS